MRRLVVISKNTKIIAIFAATVFSLTSIHLAAKAHIASLQRELVAVSNQQSPLSQGASAFMPKVASQTDSFAAEQPESLPAKPAKKIEDKSPAPLAVAARQRQIIISIADRQLAVIDHGHVLKIYPIAVGARGTPSPNGDFMIINHAKDPVYRGGDMEIPPGKDNPLGTRWMGLSLKGYGIHGTNLQSSVGKAVSHGCFRMRKQDVEELYALMQIGDTVMVRRERDSMIASVFPAPSSAQPAVTLAAASSSEVPTAVAPVTATVGSTEQ